jgi:hypothetical protein
MYAYNEELETKYFNGYGVKLKTHNSEKTAYCNSIIQLLINIDRAFAHDLYVQIYEYDKEDPILKQLKVIIDNARETLESNRERISLNKSSKKHIVGLTKSDSIPMPPVHNDPINTDKLVKTVVNEFKDSLDLKNKAKKQ